MKLIFCPFCGDIFNLKKELKVCVCGESSGKYLEDSKTVEISVWAIILCINNASFVDACAMTKRKDTFGKNVIAWILPADNQWIRRK